MAVSVCIVVFRDDYGKVFSHDPVVISLASHVCVPLSVGYLLASTFFTAMAVLNGQSRPGIVAIAFVVGAWLVCIPTAIPLSRALNPVSAVLSCLLCWVSFALPHVPLLPLQHLVGLWVALVFGYGVTTVIAMAAVLRSDWDDLAAKAVARSEGAHLAETTALLATPTDTSQLHPSLSIQHPADDSKGPELNVMISDTPSTVYAFDGSDSGQHTRRPSVVKPESNEK